MVIARPLENMRLIVETNLLSVGCIMMAGLDTFDSLLRGSGGIYHRSVASSSKDQDILPVIG